LIQEPFDTLQHLLVAVEDAFLALGAGAGFSASFATKGRIIVGAFTQTAQREHLIKGIVLLNKIFGNHTPVPFLAVLFF
jgi:hypothetical protein